MPEMAAPEKCLCRTRAWRWLTRRYVVPWALQGIVPAGHALEIGGGAGLMARDMLHRFRDLSLIVTDFDEAMLMSAKEELASYGERAEIRQADASALAFSDEEFDFVFSFIMLHHVGEWEKAVTEAVRVLRPGGWLIGYDLLDSPGLRFFHRAEGSEVRMMRLRELEALLDELAIDRVVLQPSAFGRLVRFRIRRAPDVLGQLSSE